MRENMEPRSVHRLDDAHTVMAAESKRMRVSAPNCTKRVEG